MPQPYRRVVTGHDSHGKSIFIMDGPSPHVAGGPSRGSVTDFWETRSNPADNAGDAEVIDHPHRIPPPANGSLFRIVEIIPDSQRAPQPKHDAEREGYTRDTNARHPGFHKTATTDYAIVLDGEVWALVDEDETLLKPGDVLIQRGTNHAWSNRSETSAHIAFVLIDAKPV